MIIIKVKNSEIISIILIFLLFISCKSQQISSNSQNCKLLTSDKAIMLETNQNDKSWHQLKEFYNDNNKYDIIFYKNKSGETDKTFKRIYLNKDNKWIYNEIFNNEIILQKELNINHLNLEILFNNFESGGIYKDCGMCFDCYNYLNLIKKDNKIFSYYRHSYFLDDLNNEDLQKIKPYQQILLFFDQYNLSFIN